MLFAVGMSSRAVVPWGPGAKQPAGKESLDGDAGDG
jgi:hypothetical protein